jgi:ATP-binding cassette subfamily C protein CydC
VTTLGRLLRLYRPYAWWAVAGIALNVVVVLANVGLLALSGWFIAAMALFGLGGGPIEYFAPAAAIRGLAILRTGGRYLERLVTHEATFRLLAELRIWSYEHLEPLAPACLQDYRGGDLLSRIRADIDSLDNFYLRVLVPAVGALVSAVLMLGFLASIDSQAALVEAVGLFVAGVAAPQLAQRLGAEPGRRAVEVRSKLRADAVDFVQGLGELLIDAAADRRGDMMARASASLVGEQRRQARSGIAIAAIATLASQLSLWGAIVVAIPLVRTGSLSGPELALVALFVLAGFEAVAPLSAAFQALGETVSAARRIFAIVDASPAVCDPDREARPPTRFDIRIKGLRMHYAESTKWALKGVDLYVPEGSTMGIVGPSGSGKTSIFNVLVRFWDYQEGEVTIGGVNLRELRGETVRALFGVVAQRTHLFNATIRDNLLLARPSANDADLLTALRTAHLYDEFMEFPDRLETVIGENGARLSGGQARRLAVARAILKDAPILLLDEPMEGLDTLSERAVLDGLSALMNSKTTLIITHKNRSERDVDGLIELASGEIKRSIDYTVHENAGFCGGRCEAQPQSRMLS